MTATQPILCSTWRVEENIIIIKSKVKETAVLSAQPEDQGLKSLSGKQATPEQAKDLLNFWEIGQKHFEAYVKYYILQQPSAQVPQRLNKLLTFAISKRSAKKVKLIDRERRLMNRCMRRKLAWNAKLGVVTRITTRVSPYYERIHTVPSQTICPSTLCQRCEGSAYYLW